MSAMGSNVSSMFSGIPGISDQPKKSGTMLGLPGMQETPDVDYTPEHPQLVDADQELEQINLSEEDKNRFVKIATDYRTQWAPDRLIRMAYWMKNTLMKRGQQILGWDPNQHVWFDAWAWYQQSGQMQDGDDTYIERYVNNVTGMMCEAFVGTMARSVPPVTIRPENAEILADVTTAKFSQDAIGIVERFNRIRALCRQEDTLLYLYGVYFKYTRVVIDGAWAGYDLEPQFGNTINQKPDRYHCTSCGSDTPATDIQDGQAACSDCGAPLGPKDFYPSETTSEYGVIGQTEVPRAMVRWTVHGPMEVDADPEAKTIAETPILVIEQEIDIGAARRTFPLMAAQIREGQPTSTSPNASYEQLQRNEVYSKGYAYTSDSMKQRVTYSQIWATPDAYYRDFKGTGDQDGQNDDDFAERMLQQFPHGVKLTMLGDRVMCVREARLQKEVSCCLLRENEGLFPYSVADVVVPFNLRFNDAMDMIDDYYARCSAGMLIFDRRRLDPRQLAGKVMSSGVLNGVWSQNEGAMQPIADSIFQVKFQIDPSLLTYPNMLLNFCYLISGQLPQNFGAGTQEDVATWRGQKQQLDQAQGRLNPIWENLKDEHAVAGQNAIEALQKAHEAGLVQEMFDVIEASGSEYRNHYVDLTKMRGRVRIDAQADQGLPQSPEQFRQTIETLMEQATKGSQVAIRVLDVIPNQEIAMAALGTPDMVLPAEAQRNRTLQAINTLMQNDWQMKLGPNGQPMFDLPVKPEKNVEDFVTAKETIQLFRQENGDFAVSNPDGWDRLDAYYEALEQLEMQKATEDAQRKSKVMQAGAPAPDPTLMQAKQLLLQDAAGAVQRNAAIGSSPPFPPGPQVGPVIQANKSIMDAALKAQK